MMNTSSEVLNVSMSWPPYRMARTLRLKNITINIILQGLYANTGVLRMPYFVKRRWDCLIIRQNKTKILTKIRKLKKRKERKKERVKEEITFWDYYLSLGRTYYRILIGLWFLSRPEFSYVMGDIRKMKETFTYHRWRFLSSSVPFKYQSLPHHLYLPYTPHHILLLPLPPKSHYLVEARSNPIFLTKAF